MLKPYDIGFTLKTPETLAKVWKHNPKESGTPAAGTKNGGVVGLGIFQANHRKMFPSDKLPEARC